MRASLEGIAAVYLEHSEVLRAAVEATTYDDEFKTFDTGADPAVRDRDRRPFASRAGGGPLAAARRPGAGRRGARVDGGALQPRLPAARAHQLNQRRGEDLLPRSTPFARSASRTCEFSINAIRDSFRMIPLRPGILLEMSNFYCHPGRAGGSLLFG